MVERQTFTLCFTASKYVINGVRQSPRVLPTISEKKVRKEPLFLNTPYNFCLEIYSRTLLALQNITKKTSRNVFTCCKNSLSWRGVQLSHTPHFVQSRSMRIGVFIPLTLYHQCDSHIMNQLVHLIFPSSDIYDTETQERNEADAFRPAS